MRLNTLLAASFALILMLSATTVADEADELARMERLLLEVEQVLPSGWIVEMKLADPQNPDRQGSHPTLVIKSDDLLPVEYFYPGAPFRPADEPDRPPKISQEIVKVSFSTRPYMSPKRFKKVSTQNDAQQQKRIEFKRNLLKEIPYGHKGDEPIPPHAFYPRTNDEVYLVRQYAFLWVSTQSQPIPTHHIDTLSFEMHKPWDMTIHDAHKAKEYEQILTAVQKIIVPYQTDH